MDLSSSLEFGSSQLCANCSGLQLDDETLAKTTGVRCRFFDPVFEIEDSFPGLPGIEKSSQQGCGFCSLLRYTIVSNDGLQDLTYLGVPVGSGELTEMQFRARYIFFYKSGTSRPASIVLEVYAHFVSYGREETFIFAVEAPLGATASHLGVMPIPREQVLSTNSVAWIKSCLSQCDVEHAHSHISTDKRFVPTRLLDLTNDPVKLVECRTDGVYSANRPPKYAAVSYCWGSSEDAVHQLKTNTRSLPSRFSGIQNNEMTALLRDAIQAARSLSVPYLWIDSLCIIQDDTVDWEKESIVMDRVFGNAYVTLCPLSSRSCRQGFLQRDCLRASIPFISSRHPQCSGLFTVRSRRAWIRDKEEDTPSGLDSFTEDIKSSTWIRRGWTFQETALSTRIIFFGATAIHFLCPSWQRTECQQEPQNHISQIRGRDRLSNLEVGYGLIQIHTFLQKEHFLPYVYEAWKEMVSVYSKRLFTKALDILPALSGIAASVGSHIEDEYVFGLWKSRFSENLLWHCSISGTTPPRYLHELLSNLKSNVQGAPSWSWASRRHISFESYHRVAGNYVVTRAHDETHSIQFRNRVDKNPNGEIQITTSISKLPSTLHTTSDTTCGTKMLRYEARIGEEYLADCMMDYWWPQEESDKMRMILLRSAEISSTAQDEKPCESLLSDRDIATPESIGMTSFRLAYGLLIYPTEESGTYYRIGTFVSFPVEKGGLEYFRKFSVDLVSII
ncbi:HET-domain-containing protein [Lentithecium fluviatile CBS 122367]|uniref:HET-domain-containing protein n=1 Tax=Lentithecium fluviatile CBS 122367 TaxID=1168545 RepID=A0A6G1IRB1_9PLEO|nr:HET-domain-containing protein [Lentithecium fluviatile CBS 122367]